MITPSLDEMVYVTKELNRLNIDIPVLIGGATTSKAHTAVKIAPVSKAPVIHVNDASRAVGVVSNLLQKGKKEAYTLKIREEYESFKARFLARGTEKEYVTYTQAQKNPFQIDWQNFIPKKPKELGMQTLTSLNLELL